MMELTGQNFIGKSRSNIGHNKFHATDPARAMELDPPFNEATEDEINSAVELAAEAFESYRQKSSTERADFLDAIADQIMSLGESLIVRCAEETGLTEARLKNERGRTVNQLKLFARYLRDGHWVDARIDHADPSRTPPKPDVRSMEKPLGVVGIFGASNFPLAFSVAGGDTASALAAGCTVVCKGHPAHPGTSEMVANAVLKAIDLCSMPNGTFSMMQGRSNHVGMSIVRHPLIRAVGFTGSFRGGKALFDAASMREVPIPVYAEMGSSNPVFILPEALKINRSSIAKDLAASVTLGVGQFCTNPGLVFTERSAQSKEFANELGSQIDQLSGGVMLTSDIAAAYASGVGRVSRSTGVSVVSRSASEHEGCVSAYLFETSGDHFLNDDHLQEEVFGPATLNVNAKDKNQLIEIARKLTGHLTATVHATEKDISEYSILFSILEQKVGRIIINGYPTGVEVTHAMVHGGPFPATTDSRTTSVGTNAIRRFTRPVCYQNFPQGLLPDDLKDSNPLNIWRLVDGEWKK